MDDVFTGDRSDARVNCQWILDPTADLSDEKKPNIFSKLTEDKIEYDELKDLAFLF